MKANITEAIGRLKFDPDLKNVIVGKLIAEKAKDLSDSEIERCLSNCVAEWVPRTAKTFRDCGLITIEQVVPKC